MRWVSVARIGTRKTPDPNYNSLSPLLRPPSSSFPRFHLRFTQLAPLPSSPNPLALEGGGGRVASREDPHTILVPKPANLLPSACLPQMALQPPPQQASSASSSSPGLHPLASSPAPFGDTTLTKVFVGGLAWETNSEKLRGFYERLGDILEAVVITDRHSGRSKGYGFVGASISCRLLLLGAGFLCIGCYDFCWLTSCTCSSPGDLPRTRVGEEGLRGPNAGD
jgi:hypothetical protein